MLKYLITLCIIFIFNGVCSAYVLEGAYWSNGRMNWYQDDEAPSFFAESNYTASLKWATQSNANFEFQRVGFTGYDPSHHFDNANVFGGSHLGTNGPLAVTTYRYNLFSQMNECDIERNLDKNWSSTPSVGDNSFDIASVALHEFGHCAGLDHSTNGAAVMYPYLAPGATKRNLTQDDINGIQAIYP